jgi:branched-chain amino acid transport system permease protein
MVQYIVDGLMIGMTYALVAMGLTMIFGMMDIINFAHGELYMLGAVMAYYFSAKAKLGFVASFFLSILAAFAIGLVLDRLLMKRIRNAPHAMTAAVTIGLSIFLANSVFLIMGPVPQSIPSPFALKPIFIGPILVSQARVFAAGVTVLAIVFTTWLIARTKLGRAMRATLQDRMAAHLVGVNTDRIFAFTFAYGSMLAAVAGVLLGAMFVVTPFMGESMITKAWIVVIVGGLGNVAGAVFAGLLVGVTESLAAGLWTSSWANVVAFVLVVIVLLVRPQGLFSKL